MRRIIVILVVLIAAAAAAFFLWKREEAPSNQLRLSGNIEVDEIEASFQIPGRLCQLLVDEGYTVALGDTLAVIEDTEQVRDVALKQATLDAANFVLAKLLAGSRPEEIAAAAAQVEVMRANAVRAEADFIRIQQLYKQSVATASQLDQARASRDATAADVKRASDNYRLIRKGPRQEDIDAARAQVTQAEEALKLAQLRLGYIRLGSPVSGVVLSRSVENGEYVSAGATIVTLGDLNRIYLRAYVNETDLGKVKLGQAARVTTDTYRGKVYNGRVSFISSQAEFTPRTVQTQKERVKLVYRIKIDVENTDLDLKPGMPADAEIVVGD